MLANIMLFIASMKTNILKLAEDMIGNLSDSDRAKVIARIAPNTGIPQTIGYRPTEAARMLAISRVSLWRLEKQGALVPKKVGRMRIYGRAQLEAFLQ
jgi:hypothetical protein